MGNTTSVTLLDRVKDAADEDAWSRFDTVYRSFIARFLSAQRVNEHIAEDVCQNVMKHAYESITGGQFEHNGRTGAFRNWLRQVVISQLGIYRRKAKRHEPRLPAQLESHLAREDSRLVQIWNAEHNRATLRLVLELLHGSTPPESLEIFRRTFVEGEDAAKVAHDMGRTKNAVVVVKCKVLKKARDLAANLLD